jgi:hypothetical protein
MKILCLPKNEIFNRKLNATAIPTTKSQLEVCGATARIIFEQQGKVPL